MMCVTFFGGIDYRLVFLTYTGLYQGPVFDHLYDLFQINIYTFSTRAIILGHHRTDTQICQPVFKWFKN